jgi:hypothetical protein
MRRKSGKALFCLFLTAAMTLLFPMKAFGKRRTGEAKKPGFQQGQR